MNKFIIALAVIACAGAASAAYNASESVEQMTQFAVFPKDDKEVTKLTGDKLVFRDFCITARDGVQEHLKTKMDHKAAEIFKFVAESFATTVTTVGKETGKTAEEGEQLISSDAYQAKHALIQLAETFARVLSKEFQEKIQALKEQINAENLIDTIKGACQNVAYELTPGIEKSFSEAKKGLIESGADPKMVKETKLNNLGCATMTRLSLVSRGCELLQAVLPSVQRYFE